jgi:diguanylate cyclase (GGDEF)-like protein
MTSEALDAPVQHRRVGWLPRGGMLPVPLWERRHRALWWVLVVHVPVIFVFGLARGFPLWHVMIDASPVMLLAAVGRRRTLSRSIRSCAVSAGLITSSGALVHLSGGLIEMHFHFFVVVALLTMYQDWLPYLTAIALTVFEHGTAGALSAHSVYNHADAVAHPWRWALIHGGFVLAASAANISCWRVNETEAQRLSAERDAFYAEQVRSISDQALRDPLTGLANRQLLLDRLDHALQVAHRRSTQIAVIYLDLDGFKQVNDNFGHRTGDDLLRQTAQLVSARVRGEDTTARLGGDEFVILCENVTDPAGVYALVDHLRTLVATPMTVSGTAYEVSVTGAFGVEFSDAESDAEGLLDRADVRMYAEKHSRRSTVPGQSRREAASPRALDLARQSLSTSTPPANETSQG